MRDLLLPLGHMNRPGTKLREKKAIIIHWTAGPNQTPDGTIAWFKTGQVYGSAQYVIGTKGEVVRCIPDDEVAYHCGSSQIDPLSKKVYTDWGRTVIGSNYCSEKSSPNNATIGFELIPLDMNGTLSDETILAAIELTKEIAKRDGYKFVGRHYDVVGWKNCPKNFVDNYSAWKKFVKATGLDSGPMHA
jgi:N-acetylmuramoyl-L-alanine amidase